MILSFYMRFLFVYLFVVCLASCESGKRNSDNDSATVSPSKEPEEQSLESEEPIPKAEGLENSAPFVVDSPTVDPIIADPKKTISSENGSATASKKEVPVAVPSSGGDPTTVSQSLLSEKDNSFSFEEIVNMDVIKKGGSDLFYFYMQFWFNRMDTVVQENPDNKNRWDKLCHKSDCLNGLNLQKIDTKHRMLNVIDWLSDIPSEVIFYKTDQETEPIFFLQGNLAPEKYHLRNNYNKDGTLLRPDQMPTHVQDVLKATKAMKKNNAKKIVVNLLPQHHMDPLPFFLLGEVIRKNQMDLHIVGGCREFCARYLVPAAKTVYMEPYGYILFDGNFMGLYQELQAALPAQNEAYRNRQRKEWLPSLKNKVSYVSVQLRQALASASEKNLLSKLDRWDIEMSRQFKDQLHSFSSSVGTGFKGFMEKERREFLGDLSPEVLDSLALFFKYESDDDEKIVQRKAYIDQVAFFFQQECLYYQSIEIRECSIPQEEDYLQLLQLGSRLVQKLEYEKYFSVPRAYYNVPETDKPYRLIFPSAELLMSVGIDIRGENNTDMFEGFESFEQVFLYLDEERVDNCGFFTESAPYTTDNLKKCLLGDTG